MCEGKKSNVFPVLNYLSTTPWRRMGCGCIDPWFLDLCISWRWVVGFTHLPLYPRYPLDRSLGGPQSRSWQCGKVKILYSTWTRTPSRLLCRPYQCLYRLRYRARRVFASVLLTVGGCNWLNFPVFLNLCISPVASSFLFSYCKHCWQLSALFREGYILLKYLVRIPWSCTSSYYCS
jgi:hypothetical protein